MNLLHVYLSTSFFIGVLGLMWLLSEINVTNSSFGVRKGVDRRYLVGLEFTLWFKKREEELLSLWEAEVCECMNLGFEEFCQAIFNDEFGIVYEK